MQAAADLHDKITHSFLEDSDGLLHDAALLDAAVDMLDTDPRAETYRSGFFRPVLNCRLLGFRSSITIFTPLGLKRQGSRDPAGGCRLREGGTGWNRRSFCCGACLHAWDSETGRPRRRATGPRQ